MTKYEATEKVKELIKCTEFLEPSPKAGKDHYCCPFCGSGHKTHETGAVTVNEETNKWKCNSCGKRGSVLDLIMEIRNVSFEEARDMAADMAGITIDRDRGGVLNWNAELPGDDGPKVKPTTAEYLQACAARIDDPRAVAYITGRGISLETARKCGIGFDPESDPANNPGGGGRSKYPTPRIIIPNRRGNDVSYVGRAIDPNAKIQKANAKGGAAGIFNLKAVYSTAEPHDVVVVEGAFDALSFVEAGYQAVALNSKANVGILLEALKAKPAEGARFLICLDNDGKTAADTEKLQKGLDDLQADNMVLDTAAICGDAKDPNEALQADPGRFKAAIKRELDPAKDSVSHYLEYLMSGEIARFRESSEMKTGFPNLDQKAGGLYAGLYLLAAGTSLGKTSFLLQVADQLATAGHDVIFFSLEQSRLELVSKLIARRTAQRDIKTAANALAIRKGRLTDAAIAAADDLQLETADRLSIVEGNFDCDVPYITNYTRNYIRRTGRRPILIIDYIQLVRPELDANGRVMSGREGIESVATAIKQMSRDLNLTVFAISSINRANYMQPFDFESLKETGLLEFTGDVVFGLQLQCLNDPLFSEQKKIADKRAKVREEKNRNPRRIELVCLKNRFGISSFSVYFEYYPANDLFVPGELDPEFQTGDSSEKKKRL